MSNSTINKISKDLEKKAISSLEFCAGTKAKIDTGTRCNASCYFCYYKESLDAEVKPTKEILKEIKKLISCGFTKIELSGGEPTIHPDFIKILEYITELGAEPSFLTNAIAIDPKMIKAIYTAGVRDILFSVQGLREQHDKILGHHGAFDHILTVIDWANFLDIRVRVNTVVTNNWNDLAKLWRILKDNIKIWNLLPLNHWDDADKLKRLNYTEPAGIFNYLLNNRNPNDPVINIRYFPLCFIHTQHRDSVLNYWHQYNDIDDWHPFFMSQKDITPKKLKAFKDNDQEYYRKDLLQKRELFFIKDKECLTCELFNVCDGYKK